MKITDQVITVTNHQEIAPITPKEVAAEKTRFWKTDSNQAYKPSYELNQTEMRALQPYGPILAKPTPSTIPETLLFSQFTKLQGGLPFPEVTLPEYTEENFPALMFLEQPGVIAQMGQEQGMSQEEIGFMQYWNNHRAAIEDPAVAEFLASVDERANENLKKDYPNVATERAKAAYRKKDTTEKDAAALQANFNKQLKETNLSEDKQIALAYAFAKGKSGNPETAKRAQEMKEQAFVALKNDFYIPPGVSPPEVDTYAIDDTLSFEAKNAFNDALAKLRPAKRGEESHPLCQ